MNRQRRKTRLKSKKGAKRRRHDHNTKKGRNGKNCGAASQGHVIALWGENEDSGKGKPAPEKKKGGSRSKLAGEKAVPGGRGD